MPRSRDERLRAKQEETLAALAAGQPARIEVHRVRLVAYTTEPNAQVLEVYLENDLGRYRSNPDFEMVGGSDVAELLSNLADLVRKFSPPSGPTGQLEQLGSHAAQSSPFSSPAA